MPAADHVVGDLDYSAATTSSGRVTVLPDSEGGSSAADNEGSNGPTLSTSNGSTIATYSAAEFLDWPIQSGVNGRTTVQGFAYWYRPHGVNPANFNETLTAWNTTGSASGTRFNITQHGGALEVYGGPGDPTWVRSVASLFASNTWVFLYVAFDGGATGEARLRVFTCNTSGTVTEHTTSVDTGTLGTTLPSVTGTQIIGAYDDSGTDAVDGDYGQHLWALDGLLTSGEIQELANIDPPVDLGLDREASGAGTLAPFVGAGTASTIDASGGGELAPFVGAGVAEHPRVATGGGELAPFVGAGSATTQGAVGAGILAPFAGAGVAAALAAASGAGTLAPFVGAGSAAALVAAAGGGQLGPFVGAGSAALVRAASGAGALGPFVGAGTAARVVGVRASALATERLRTRAEATDRLRATARASTQ